MSVRKVDMEQILVALDNGTQVVDDVPLSLATWTFIVLLL